MDSRSVVDIHDFKTTTVNSRHKFKIKKKSYMKRDVFCIILQIPNLVEIGSSDTDAWLHCPEKAQDSQDLIGRSPKMELILANQNLSVCMHFESQSLRKLTVNIKPGRIDGPTPGFNYRLFNPKRCQSTLSIAIA
ncbi:hypothetical protein TSAR_006523 [Trichomalopsis sarcophagae]|uniref:Uncharacterized protein n=1 Tax=Trichomalopsis sarcophagae TaxID=543379 RepID=A0A232EQL4_9HYME|nr:hypothetical protein TSAR_006523 [Trichomalopsis sarcophagae]